MRRIAAIIAVVAAGAAVLAVPAAGGPDEVQVAAIVDQSNGLIASQEVRVAGATVGIVDDVELTDDVRARVVMTIDGRFTPFREDATCEIRAQSLIGEKFIQCDPGTPDRPPLAEQAGLQTVPVEQTSVPVDMDIFLSALRRPEQERLQIILNEMGASIAARGDDLNETIRRANPALRDARLVLDALAEQRSALERAIDATDEVLVDLEPERERIGELVDRTREVTDRTSRHAQAISETVRTLPGLLREAEPTFEELAALAREATPLTRDLTEAAAPTRQLLSRVGPLSDVARPALSRLGRAAVTGRRAFEAARPVADALPGATEQLLPISELTAEVMPNLLEKGIPENLQRFVYYATAATSRFDATSHIAPAHFIGSSCLLYNEGEPDPICSGRFQETRERERHSAPREQDGEPRERRERPSERVADERPDLAPVPEPEPTRTAPDRAPTPSRPKPAEGKDGQPSGVLGGVLDRAVDRLLGDDGALGRLGGRGDRSPDGERRARLDILDWLLGD